MRLILKARKKSITKQEESSFKSLIYGHIDYQNFVLNAKNELKYIFFENDKIIEFTIDNVNDDFLNFIYFHIQDVSEYKEIKKEVIK